jgi:hypothetical protein
MHMPGGEHSQVPHGKLTGYLLSQTHPVGRWKARFFIGHGYRADAARELERELLEIARVGELVETRTSIHGIKYVVAGTIESRSGGESVRVRTVWIVEQSSAPRFVTAYPA